MIDLSKYEFWFLTGSQYLYGEETLKEVRANSKKIVEALNNSGLPYKIVCKEILTDSDKILAQFSIK